MLTQDSIEELNQNYDDMSCVTVVTGTTVISFFAWDRIIDLPEEFVHAVEYPRLVIIGNGQLQPW